MTTAADLRRAIDASAVFAKGQAPDDAPDRALLFIAYLAGTLKALDEPGLYQLLHSMLPALPAAPQ